MDGRTDPMSQSLVADTPQPGFVARSVDAAPAGLSDRVVRLGLACFLLVGLALRVVEAGYDRFDYDEYVLRIGIEQGFGDYAARFVGEHELHFPLHYWLTYRLLGGHLLAYRSLSLLAGAAALLMAAAGLLRFWPERKVMALLAVLLLAVNQHAFYVNRYLFGYANTFFLAIALFFLFLRLAEGPLARGRWRWIALAAVPLALFANNILVVPLTLGAGAALLFRWWRYTGPRTPALLARWVCELGPLLVVPLVFLVRQLLYPFGVSGIAVHQTLVHLFYPTSGAPRTPAGLAQFLLARTESLFSSLLLPIGLDDIRGLDAVFLGLCALLVVLAVVHLLRRRDDWRMAFTAFFLVVSVLLLAVAGVLGLYPYGTARYASFLVLPAAILIGAGAEWLYQVVAERVGSPRLWQGLIVTLSLLVLLGGGLFTVMRWRANAAAQAADHQALAWLQRQSSDLVLTDNYIWTILNSRAPGLHAAAHPMGLGSDWGTGQVPPDKAAALAATPAAGAPGSVLVILSTARFAATDRSTEFAHRFPAWHDLLNRYYRLETAVRGTHLEGRLYVHK